MQNQKIMNSSKDDEPIANTSVTDQLQSFVSDKFINEGDFSLAGRVINGIIICILFIFGTGANLVVLHVLRVKGILLKNTSTILINLITTDLICSLVVLPQDFAFYVVNATFPQAYNAFKIYSVLKNATMFLNCGFSIVLSVERRITATYLGRRRGQRLSKSLMLCLATVWLSSVGAAAVTYYTLRESNPLPRKLLGQASSASSRCPSAGNIMVMILVFVALLTVLFSLRRMRSFLHKKFTADNNTVSKEKFQGLSKREVKRRKMLRRITFACFASLLTLALSYIPVVATWLLWYGLAWQNSDANAVVQVLCSLPHTVNPVIATVMSSRLQNAFVRVMKSVQPFHTLLKRYPSLADSIGSFTSQGMNLSCRMNNNENLIMMESNFQDNMVMINSPSPEVSSHNEACSPHKNVGVDSAVVWDRHDTSNVQVIAKKPPLIRKRSLSAGNVLRSHYLQVPQEGISKRFSDIILTMDWNDQTVNLPLVSYLTTLVVSAMHHIVLHYTALHWEKITNYYKFPGCVYDFNCCFNLGRKCHKQWCLCRESKNILGNRNIWQTPSRYLGALSFPSTRP